LAAHYFTKNPPNGKLYVLGNSGIQQELAKVKGLEIITEEKGKNSLPFCDFFNPVFFEKSSKNLQKICEKFSQIFKSVFFFL